MKTNILKIVLLSASLVLTAVAPKALAHEVYVLPEEKIEQALSQPSPNPIESLRDRENISDFITWSEVLLVALLLLFFLPWKKILPKFLQHDLVIARKYAFPVVRIFLGISLVLAGLNKSLFGPEIPISEIGPETLLIAALLVGGAMLTFNLLTRWVSVFLAVLYIFAFFKQGIYLLTYFEFLALFLLFAFNDAWRDKYGAVVMRVGFGIALLWTAINVKFLNSQLSLEVVNAFGLDQMMNFNPLFLVLGAGLMELMIATFYIFGLQLRFVSLFFATFATAAMFVMHEVIWPHIILYGLAIAIFMYGYDKYALQRKIQKID